MTNVTQEIYQTAAVPGQHMTGKPMTGQPMTGQLKTGQPKTGQPKTGQPAVKDHTTGEPFSQPLMYRGKGTALAADV